MCFMHPVKAEEAIAEAYFEHGVRTFSLDTIEELDKIVRATATDGVAASDLNLLVRIRVSSDHAKLSLASKFGADPREVKALLFAARQAADALGICFHVGSQAMTPGRLSPRRWSACAQAIVEAAVTVDIVDVGGGFPSVLSGHGAAAAGDLFRGHPRRRSKRCRSATRPSCGASRAARCAPNMRACSSASRSAAATSSTSTTAPMARCSTPRTSAGASGAAGPRRANRDARPMAFSFYGPTCDDLDHMAGPFDAAGGRRRRRLYRDRHARRLWLRDAHRVQRLRRRSSRVIVDDEPMASLYGGVDAAGALERREAVSNSPARASRRKRGSSAVLSRPSDELSELTRFRGQ